MSIINTIKVRIKWLIRGGSLLTKYFLFEKPRGLDFSLRQKERGITRKGNHGYALTQEKAFNDIMKKIAVSNTDSFIDIGCGKGGTLLYASKYPFQRVAGVEIEESLFQIAKNNFKRLQMPQIELYKADAVMFDNYWDYNVLFMFNPFDEDIYKKVIDKVFSTFTDERRQERAYVICYGATITEYIKNSGIVDMKYSYTDRVRGTGVVIWEWDRIKKEKGD